MTSRAHFGETAVHKFWCWNGL